MKIKRISIGFDWSKRLLFERNCEVCKATTWNAIICPDCRASFYETLAKRIDPAALMSDKDVTWESCTVTIAKLYGKQWEDDLARMRIIYRVEEN